MIEFKNKPPKQAGDVEITDLGLNVILQRRQRTSYEDQFHYYGVLICENVLHAMETAEPDPNTVTEILLPIINTVREGNAGYISACFEKGIASALGINAELMRDTI